MHALQPCGTWAAYKRHKKAGEAPCPECAAACRAQFANRYVARPRAVLVAACPVCGSEFVPAVNRKRGYVQQTCSRFCARVARIGEVPVGPPRTKRRVCEICWASYTATYADQRTCRRNCGATLAQFRRAGLVA